MPDFRVPLRDIRFLLNEVFEYPAHYRSIVDGDDASPEVVDAILEATARYCENVLAPLNASGDRPVDFARPISSSSMEAGRACLFRWSTAGRAGPCP